MKRKAENHGKVQNPLNTDWSAWRLPGESQESMDLRIRRRTSRSRALRFRSVPVARRIWWVTLTVAAVSVSEIDSQHLPVGLTFDPRAFWCKSKRLARRFCDRDVAMGGSPALYPVEYRLCPVCHRMLLGAAAADYRLKLMRPVKKWQYERGPACSSECVMPALGRPAKRRAA